MKQEYLNRKFVSPLRVMFSPFSFFDDLKYIQQGALWQIPIQILFLFLARVAILALNGFLFNTVKLESINILFELTIVIVIYLAFVISNWAFCILSDGEGSFVEIALVSAFAVIPYIIGCLITVGLTNIFVIREQSFIQIISFIFNTWSGILLVIGIKTVHQLSMKKTLFSLVITIVFMLLMAFFAVIVFSMTQQLLIFIMNIYNEIIFRM